MQIWSTGGRSLNSGRLSLAAESWAEACVRLLCFCGDKECRTALKKGDEVLKEVDLS